MNLDRIVNETEANNIHEINKESVKHADINSKIFYLSIKRFFDLIFSLIGLIILSPVFLIVAILIRIDSKGPAFFIQERIGKNGKIFKLYKFRSMIQNADEVLFKILRENEEAAEEYRINKKFKNDIRVTKIGAFIRGTSIDELPQLLNVFLGNMSFIGPRPYLERELIDIDGYYDYIVACKPGLSGLWQVSGRNNLTFEDRLKIDKEYFYIRGLSKDIKIFCDTVKFVITKEGAM